MTWEVAEIFIVMKGEVADRVIYLGGGMDRRILGVSEVNQVYPVLFGVEGPLLAGISFRSQLLS